MARKKHSAEQIVAILRQIEVELASNGGWIYTDLHDFTGGDDGAFPLKGPSLDTAGNIYGTAYYAGSNGAGVVWEITP